MIKKILKAILYFFLSIIVLIVILTVAAKFAENKITHMVMEKVSEEIHAPVKIESVSFNLLRKFPLATIELEGISLGTPVDSVKYNETGVLPDTILNIGKIYFSVKTRPLLNNEIDVVKIEVLNANIEYLIDVHGKTNIDFLIPPTDTSEIVEVDTMPSEPLFVTLKEFSLKNINIIYRDDSTATFANLRIPELKMSGRVRGDTIGGAATGSIELSNCGFPETNLHLMNKTILNFDVEYADDSVHLKSLTLNTDGMKLNAVGNIKLGDEIFTDMVIDVNEMDLGELMKYAPAEILKEYGIKKVAGNLTIKTSIKGIYKDPELPKVDIKISMKAGQIITTEYPQLNNISFAGNITNGFLQTNQTTQIDFSSFHFETGESKFDFDFSVLDIDHPKYKVNSDMTINVSDFKSFIPDSTLKSIDGVMAIKFSTKGQLPDSIGDDFTDYVLANTRADVALRNFNIEVDDTLSLESFSAIMAYRPNSFELSHLNVSIPAYHVNLKNTGFDCKFTGSTLDLNAMVFDIKSYRVETDSSLFSGSIMLKNLDKPNYSISSHSELNLAELKNMIPDSDSLLNRLEGKIIANITSAGIVNLDSIDQQMYDLALRKTSYNLIFKNIYVEMPNDPLSKVDNFNAQVRINPKRITINKLSGNFAGIDFAMDSTEILNVYETFIEERRDVDLIVQTVVEMGVIDYGKIMAMMPPDPVSTDSSEVNEVAVATNESTSELDQKETNNTQSAEQTVELSETDTTISTALLPDFEAMGMPHFLIRGKVSVKQIKYEKNILDDVSMLFRFADSLYVIDQFKFKMCDGDLNTSVLFDARNWKQPKVDVRNYINHLDLKQFLMVNDNFGDTLLTYDKVSGILTSELNTRAFYVDSIWPTEKIRVQGNFTIEEGKIYDYPPLAELSTNIGGLKELNKLDFNTLKSSIFMFKDKIYIPKTDVVSSALDLSAFAMQSMGDDYEYHIVLHLSDVLKGKSDKLMKEQAKQNKKDGGTVERNGLNLVSMQVGDKKKNGFDNEKLKSNFKNQLNIQQGFLQLLFNPMLVNFSTDMDRTARNKEILEEYEKSKIKQ